MQAGLELHDFIKAALADREQDVPHTSSVILGILREHGPSIQDPTRCRVCTAIAHGHATRYRHPCPTVRLIGALFDTWPGYQHALWAAPGQEGGP